MRSKNRLINVKKILVLIILALFLSSSIFIGVSVADNDIESKKEIPLLEPAQEQLINSDQSTSKQATSVKTNKIMYGDGWLEVINPDGTRTRSIGIPTYYRNGAYYPVDTTIKPLNAGEYSFGVEDGKYQAYFKEDVSEPMPVMVNYNNYELSMQFNDMGYFDYQTYKYKTIPARSSYGLPQQNKMKYQEILPDIDLEFDYGIKQLKENFILNDISDYNFLTRTGKDTLDFKFDIFIPNNLELWADNDKVIDSIPRANNLELKNSDGKIIFHIPTPIIYEQNNCMEGINGYYEISITEFGAELILKSSIDWLSDPTRQFPIIIDPTIDIKGKAPANQVVSVYSGLIRTNIIYTGWWSSDYMHGYHLFNLSTIPKFSTILSGEFYAYVMVGGVVGTGGLSITPYRVIEHWTESSMAGGNVNKATFAESHAAGLNLDTAATWYNWNITSLVQGWISGYYANYGLAITTTVNSGATNNYAYTDHEKGSFPPYINITYVNNSVQIAPPINVPPLSEDVPKDITLANHEHRRFEKYSTKKSVSGNPPFWASGYTELRYQMLYHQTDIGMAGIIDIISFNKTSAGTGSYDNFSVRMAHTTLDTLTTNYESNYFGELIEVYNVSKLNVNQPINSWITLDIDNIFNYQPFYNLIVEIRYNGSTGSNSGTWATNLGSAHALYDNNYYAITGTNLNWRNDLKFEILSSDESYFDDWTSGYALPFWSSSILKMRSQLLYRQEYLGKSGIIDKIYFHKYNSAFGSYENFTMTLSHTNKTELTTNLSFNYGSGTPVEVIPNSTQFVSGPGGSWFELDVDDIFYYNNFDNLIIELDWETTNSTSHIFTRYRYLDQPYVSHAREYDTGSGLAFDVGSRFLNLKFKFKDINLTWKVSGVNNDLIDVSPTGPPGDDQFTITPMPNANGEDIVRFTLHDSHSNWTTYQDVNIIVEPVNDPPETPFNLTPGQKSPKEWFSSPIMISWEYMDIDSPQDNVTLEYRIGLSGGWQNLFNSTDFGVPYPDHEFVWPNPPNEAEIYIRVRTFDGEYWSPWNISQNPIGFDNVSKIVQNVEIKDLDKDNTEFVKDDHDVLITATLTEKFFAGILPVEPIFYANLVPFGNGSNVAANLSGLPQHVTWRIDDVSTTPKNGLVPFNIWSDPMVIGFDLLVEANTTADNLPVEIQEPSIKPDQWINKTDNIEFNITISDEGSGVDFSSMQFSVWLDGDATWGPWQNIIISRSRGNFIIPKVLLNLNEGGNNKVRARAQDIIGNDYIESPPYIIKIDSSGIEYSEIGAGTAVWFKNTKVLAKINITDNVSGVKPSTIRFRNSTNGLGSYKNWSAVPPENIKVEGNSVICSVEVDFVEGGDNYLQWYAEDHAGNQLESDHLNYKVDMTPPTFSNADPPNNGFVNNYTYECSISIEDAPSGVNTSTIQYQTSKDGTENYGSWKDATITGGTRAIQAVGAGDFTDGDKNYIQWRAMDFAGNVRTSIDYKITIDSTKVNFTNAKPVQTTDPSTWSTTKEVNCSITIVDTISDVDATSIEYRYSTDGNAEAKFGAWTSAHRTAEENAKSITVTVKVIFIFGENNWIQWRAKDKAGNSAESDKYQVRVKGLDADSDGMPDAWEKQYNLDPNDPNDADLDNDKDGLSNLEEYELLAEYGQSTDPTNKDTDGDGAIDGYEVEKGTNPFNNADTPAPKKTDGEKEGGFDFLWILILIVVIIIVLLIIFFLMRRKKQPEEMEERPTREAEEVEEEETEDWEEESEEAEEEGEEVGGWELADEEDEVAEKDFEEPVSAADAELEADAEPEFESEDEDFIDIDLESTDKPMKGKAPPVKKGKAPKKRAIKKPVEEPEEFEEEFDEEFEDEDFEDEEFELESEEELEPEKKEPSVIRHGKPKKVMVPAASKKPIEKKVAGSKKVGPMMLRLDESTPCNICLGVIKTGLAVIKCKCGKKYHDSCANRVGICPSCDTDLSNPIPLEEDEPEEMTDDDLEAFDIDD